MSSVATCKLNATYKEALEGTRFKYVANHYYTKNKGWGGFDVCENVLLDTKSKDKKVISVSSVTGQLSCCGLNELICTTLQKDAEAYIGQACFAELIAKYLKHGVEYKDKRVLIIGIPVKVGTNSMYSIKFYEALRETLEDFGFRQVGQPYKNQNSKNTIVAMVGQLP